MATGWRDRHPSVIRDTLSMSVGAIKMRIMAQNPIEPYIRAKFAEAAGLPEETIFGEDLSLAALIAASQTMTNSLDLMEAFARTSNALRRDHGARVRLPALPLDTPASQVLKIFIAEFEAQTAATSG
jgi:hypothetical protein